MRLFLYVILAVSIIGCAVKLKKPKYYSSFSYLELHKINPDLILDTYSLSSEGHIGYLVESSIKSLLHKGLVVNHPILGLVPLNPNITMKIVIQSPGGIVDGSLQLLNFINHLRRMNIKTECYIGEASSMAFTIAVVGCDKRIVKRSARLLQHRTYYPNGFGKTFTVSTFNSDIKIATMESQALGIPLNKWMSITKTEKDKIFTPKEMEQYKLVHEWID